MVNSKNIFTVVILILFLVTLFPLSSEGLSLERQKELDLKKAKVIQETVIQTKTPLPPQTNTSQSPQDQTSGLQKFFFQNLSYPKNLSTINQGMVFGGYDIEYTSCTNKRDKKGNIVSCSGTEILQRKFVSGEVIIKFKENSGINSETKAKAYLAAKASQKTTANSASLASINSVKKVSKKQVANDIKGLNRIYKIKVSENADILKAVNEYSKDSNIEYAEPNFIAQTFFTPNDPRFSEQWAHRTTQAEQGWDIQRGSSGIVIAILDTGVDYNHPDLSGNIWNNIDEIPNNGVDDDSNGFVDDRIGYDFVNVDPSLCHIFEDCADEDNSPMDFNGHGTHVSGIAAATTDNTKGIAGVCNYCKIMPIRAGWSDPNGGGSLTIEDIIQGVIYATDNGADIISMSFGGGDSQAEKDALDYAYSREVILIAAAGNNGSSYKSYPAGYDNVISVSAADPSGYPAWFTNYGSWVDVAAPGVSILSTLPNSQYASWDGTSMAAPYVAGLAGLTLSKNQFLTNEQVRNILRTRVDLSNFSDKYFGTGRINVFKALQMNSVPIANLDPGLDDKIFSGNGAVNIIGTAIGNVSWTSYILEYGQGIYPTTWSLINSGTGPAISSSLGTFNSLSVPDGVYSLRLKVRDSSWAESIDKAVVSIDNLKITKPIYRDLIRPGNLIEIRGDVFASPTSYSVEYYSDSLGSWSTLGITKTYPTFPKGDALLATWDTSAITQPGFVFLKITINTVFGTFSEQTTIYADSNLKQGWPKKIEGDFINYPTGDVSYYMHAGPFDTLVKDLNNDGNNEIIFASQGTNIRLHVLDINGNYINNWPIELPNSRPDAWGSLGPVIGNIDADAESEIIIGSYTENKIYAFNYNGSLVSGFPVTLPYKNISGYDYGVFLGSLSLADINNDGKNEIIVFAEDPGYLAILNNQGVLLPGNPHFFNMNIGSDIKNGVSLGNFDADPDLEVVISYSNYNSETKTGSAYIDVLNKDGSHVVGWPVIKQDFIYNSPAIGDIDGDGNAEIVVGYGGGSGVYAFDKTGQVKSGWPRLQGYYFTSSPALLDINNDGHLEIVISEYLGGSGNTYVLNYDGTTYSGWPQYKQMSDYLYMVDFKSPFTTQDGSSEKLIFEAAGEKLYGWDKNGNSLPSFPKQTYGYAMTESGAYVGDIDNDGLLEIVISGQHRTPQGTLLPPMTEVMVWETTLTKGNKVEWPQFRHDGQYTGLYGYDPQSPTCSDTDGGKSYNIKGTVTATNSSGTLTHQDTCTTSNSLKEYYCNASKIVSSENHYCTYGCSYGKCNPNPNPPCYIDPKTKKKVCNNQFSASAFESLNSQFNSIQGVLKDILLYLNSR